MVTGAAAVTTRPSWDATFLAMAEAIGRRTTCPRAFKLCPDGIGAVLVERHTHRALGFGYCGSSSGEAHCADVGCAIGPAGGCVRTVHAETNAIINARAFMGPKTLYCTVSPCLECLEFASENEVVRIVYRHAYRILEPVMERAEFLGVELVHLPTGEKQ